MNKVAIRANDLVKEYRLYRSPTDRLLDVMGLLRRAEGRYSEHRALDGISFEIRAGEKVGIIGRNGAGKSTLLKMITRTIEPTSGQLEVNGATQALLQIGTGFHPDFTGRDNVISYLAQMGISGARAELLAREIIEFAEIEEYIDQPVKTYSTGMSARLMFAASTVIEPDLLVIDEILGVGDAYFSRKSYDRIKSLCSRHDTTLLLVSHDIYSAAQICDRMIWIDRGRMKFDGEPKSAINLYEASIKEQEEIRLRRKALLATGQLGGSRAKQAQMLIELRSTDGAPLTGSLFLYEAALCDGTTKLAIIDPVKGRAGDEDTSSLELVFEGSSWQTTEEAGRTDGIILANHGSPFHKGMLRAQFGSDLASPVLSLAIESATEQAVSAIVYGANQVGYLGGHLALKAGHRVAWNVPLDVSRLERISDLIEGDTETRHGSGAIRITGVDILDGQGGSVRQLTFGAPVTMRMSYVVQDATRAAAAEVNIAIFRDGVLDVMRLFGTDLNLAVSGTGGIIEIRLPKLLLAPGTYLATILVAKSGYYEAASGKPFSINPDVFDVLSRSLGFAVKPTHPAFNGTVAVQEATWEVRATG
jgi:lipopolysaccharide transport system ATP-binding protein